MTKAEIERGAQRPIFGYLELFLAREFLTSVLEYQDSIMNIELDSQVHLNIPEIFENLLILGETLMG
jgi:hypothetical protein